jgi:hypothetical protein
MDANWVASAGTTIVGLAGIAATYVVSRNSGRLQIELSERKSREEAGVLRRKEMQARYEEFMKDAAEVLQVTRYLSMSEALRHPPAERHDPPSEAWVKEGIASTRRRLPEDMQDRLTDEDITAVLTSEAVRRAIVADLGETVADVFSVDTSAARKHLKQINESSVAVILIAPPQTAGVVHELVQQLEQGLLQIIGGGPPQAQTSRRAIELYAIAARAMTQDLTPKP